MNNKLTVSFALLAGLAGGMLTRFIAPAPVFAQAPVQAFPAPAPRAPAPAPTTPAPVAKEIRAESFAIVDQYGRVAGTFTAESMNMGRPGRIVLRDSYGHEIWGAGGSSIRPLMSTTR